MGGWRSWGRGQQSRVVGEMVGSPRSGPGASSGGRGVPIQRPSRAGAGQEVLEWGGQTGVGPHSGQHCTRLRGCVWLSPAPAGPLEHPWFLLRTVVRCSVRSLPTVHPNSPSLRTACARRLLPAPSGCLVGKELLPGAAPRPPAGVLPWVPGGLGHVLLLRPDVPD